jgi:hypothetical protein
MSLAAVATRPAGDAPTTIKATTTQGQIGVVDAKAQNVVRLMLACSLLWLSKQRTEKARVLF